MVEAPDARLHSLYIRHLEGVRVMDDKSPTATTSQVEHPLPSVPSVRCEWGIHLPVHGDHPSTTRGWQHYTPHYASEWRGDHHSHVQHPL